MARRINGGIIGPYNLPTADATVGVYDATAAGVFSTVGLYPTVANTVAAPLVTQTGNVVKPVITSVVYCNDNWQEIYTGANAGIPAGASLRLLGQNFLSNTTIYVNGSIVNTAGRYINSQEIRTSNIALGTGSYTLMAFNTSNVGSAYLPGLQFRAIPVWITNATLSQITANAGVSTDFSYTVSASDATTLTYSLTSDTVLPANTSFNASTRTFAGNITTAGSYTIGVNVTNIYGQAVRRDFSLTVVSTYTVAFLVVAGGGGGGFSGGSTGAGGGGGGGGVLQGTALLKPGQPYSITVGGGGAATVSPALNNSNPGGPSMLSGPGITTQTAQGGGGGAGQGNPGNGVGNGQGYPGGSGGGTVFYGTPQGNPVPTGFGFPSPAPTFYTPTGAQGYPAGDTPSGGGGGAGGAGTPGRSGSAYGAGGPGYIWSTTGNTYARGGASGIQYPGYGTWGGPTVPVINSGNGGDGGFFGNPSGGPGTPGSAGVVVLAVPNVAYAGWPGSSPGAVVTTPPNAPGQTVLTYTAPGTYTA